MCGRRSEGSLNQTSRIRNIFSHNCRKLPSGLVGLGSFDAQFVVAVPPCVCNDEFIGSLVQHLAPGESMIVVVPDKEEPLLISRSKEVVELHDSKLILPGQLDAPFLPRLYIYDGGQLAYRQTNYTGTFTDQFDIGRKSIQGAVK